MESYYKTLFFDFDGTIHDSIHVYYPAFIKAYSYLALNGLVEPRDFTKKEVSKWLGYNSVEMWKAFLPDCPPFHQEEARTIIGKEMQLRLENGDGVLYDGAIETLKYLKDKGYTLVFLSNCGEVTMQTAAKVFHLDQYFDRFECSAQHGQMPKWKILKHMLFDFEREMAIIGDRFHDMEAGFLNDITTIGCSYGYGHIDELHQANKIITSISQLKSIF
ncbi:MAG TPA: HAD family hydrolase [Clostridiales bacterium UBA8960]|nr:HAD family hydrolase [Clostridiales bacterium UBA8960]